MKKVINIILLLLLFLIFSLLIRQPSFSKPVIHDKKSVIISLIEADYIHYIIKDIVSAAYTKIGIGVKFYELPAKRSLEWANIGKTDGDLARIDKTEEQYANLIKIPVSLITIKGVIFTKNINRNIHDWEDMKGLVIGIRNGIRYYDTATTGLNRVFTKDLTNLFMLLSRDRIDIAIADYDIGRYEVAKYFRGSNIHIIGQPLKKDELFHYVNKKNILLVPRLKAVLQKMAESGEIEAIREKAIQRTLSE